MIKLVTYLLRQGMATARELFPDLAAGVRGLPRIASTMAPVADVKACADLCPTNAIAVKEQSGDNYEVILDRGKCIACGVCMQACPTVFENDRSTKTASLSREGLVLSSKSGAQGQTGSVVASSTSIFNNSIAARVVATGCSACDSEIGATGNPIFDMERFGVHVVASPRFADVLLVTGPVSKGMQDPLSRCYQAMAEPKRVIAVGTCAISGGVHAGGYASADGADKIVPVDVYIPGCAPHPWSIIYGIKLAMQIQRP